MADDRRSSFSQTAVTSLATLLEGDPSTRRLATAELTRRSRHRPVAGWQVTLPVACASSKVDFLLPPSFPWTPPVLVLVDPPRFREWPHVEQDGTLCLLGDVATVDALNPRGVARHLLVEAAALVAELLNGGLREDFRSEFRSYWPEKAGDARRPIISICDAVGASRPIRCWSGRDSNVIGDDDQAIRNWLLNRGWSRDASPSRTHPAVLAYLAQPPLPEHYPVNGASLLAFLDAHAPEAAAMARSATTQDTDELVVALYAATDRGPTLVAAIMERPQPGGGKVRRPDPVRRGFRPGRVPPATLLPRLFSGQHLPRVNVERADASWIHGRDRGDGFERLRSSHVVFVGCGSLGSPVIRLLAQAGLGSMTVIDPDVMGWPNVGRHMLGAGSVGRSKARAMAQAIRSDFPHVRRAEAITDRMETLISDGTDGILQADAIISTTADWSSNNALDHWAIGQATVPTLVFGWLEPHACAGHVVALRPPLGCLGCGFDRTGRPLFRITEWEGRGDAVHEPACGTSFQPYGPTEVTMVSTMVADTVMDVLMGRATLPMYRVWATRRMVLERNGGRWTPEWLACGPASTAGGILVERPWGGDACMSCAGR